MATDRREARRAALRARLADEGLDGLIVTRLPNVRYLTGFTGTSGVAVVVGTDAVFVSDFRYAAQAEAEVAAAARVEIVTADLWGRVWSVLREHAGLDTVGFEANDVTVQAAERFGAAREAAGCRFRGVSGLVERLRERKDPDEVEAIRHAAALALEALDAVLPVVQPGVREIEVAVALEAELRRRGSEWHPFPTSVASGPRSALPHARTGTRGIVAGDWLLLDFGAQVDGYCADLTRTMIVGASPDERQRLVYELVRDAQLAARRGVRAGMTGRDADALARGVIQTRGFGDAFGHGLGHGVGLEVHEGPRLSRTNADPLPDGAVVTIEPGVYFPGWGGVRIEDDVHVTADGVVALSGACAELRVVG